jgi:UPF0755 protein
VAVVAVIATARALIPETSAPEPDPHGPKIRVVIPSGANAEDIGAILEKRGVVEDGGRFADYVDAAGEGASFQAGRYGFRAGAAYDRLIERLNAGPPAPTVQKLVIPEGLRLTEIAQRVREVGIPSRRYLRAVRAAEPPAGFPDARGKSLEGFLFPATYDIRKSTTARALVRAQLDAFSARWAGVDLRYAKSRNLTAYDVLKIASMIEREAKVARERPLVSAVIYNRLRRDMRLEIDATLLYGLGSWTAPLTVSQLERDGPYNSRTRAGLPPTPISNPGLASIEAAARPAKVNYLYYVAKGDSGQHFFTADYDEFLANGGGG